MTFMKRSIRTAALALAAAMLTQTSALAAGYTKDEVAYITMDSAGVPQQTVIVNSFKTNGNTTLVDYGAYKNIKNLTSDELPDASGGKIVWNNVVEDTFYYQGEKDGGELPWNFSITYTLNGKHISGEDMIGKSGKASITIEANINNKADKYYTSNYMAQITMVLDTKRAANIVCTNAITASVGSNKQLTFMVLPTRSKTYTVTFDAQDFEMDGLTIAAIKLSDGLLGNTIDNVSSTMSGVTNGIQSLIDGTGLLRSGADDLVSGVSLLNSGAQSIESSIPVLSGGVSQLRSGVWQTADGMSQIAAGSSEVRSGLMTLSSSSADIENGISAIEGGLGEMSKNIPAIKHGLYQLQSKKQSINTLASSGETLVDGYSRVNDGLSQITEKRQDIADGLDTLHSASTDISPITNGLSDLNAGMSSISGACDTQTQIIDALIQQASQDPALAGMVQQLAAVKYISQGIKSGAGTAAAGISQLSDGVNEAQQGINTLYTAADTFGTAALAMVDGAQTIHDNMDTLNSGLREYTDGASSVSALYDSAKQFGDSALALAEGAKKLEDGTRTLSEGYSRYAAGVGTLADRYIELDNGIFTAERGAQELKAGTDSAIESADMLVSVVEELCDGISTLNDSAAALPGGAQQLEDGTQTLYDGLSDIDIAALLTKGKNAKAVSYAAPYVAQPDKVQFLMKTPNLHIEDETAADAEEEKLSFWQKLIALFKKEK